jgi:hypothetical protein
MRVMVLVKATDVSEQEAASPEWTRRMLAEMASFNQDLERAGILLAAAGLQPTAKAKRIVFDGTRRTVIDGPFAETKELIAGYWLWDVQDMDEAIAWARRCPNPMPVPSEIEIRPLYE